MFVQSLANRLARRRIHYGWVVVALTFLTMLTSSAALGLPGALIQPLSREFGWNTEQISSVLALRFALYGLLGPFSAILIERYGMRKIMCTALLLIAGSMASVTMLGQLWQLFILWGLILGLGSGMTALVLGAMVANRWFEKRRGLVIGMLTASSATGQLIFLPVAAWLIEHLGWRAAVLPVFASCLTTAVLAFIFMRDRPEDVGARAFGAEAGAPVPANAGGRGMPLWEPVNVLRGVIGNRTFLILAATFFICGLSTNGLIQTHFISLCGDYGLTAIPAAGVLAMMGGFDFFGTILSGWLSDRYDSRKLLFWYYSLRGLSLLWLPHSTFSLYGLSIFAMFYGLDWIATVPPTVKLAAAGFGKERAGMVFGWIFAAHQLGAAVAAYGAGSIRTVLLTYTPALYIAGGLCLVAGLIAMGIKRPRPLGAAAAPA
ncbi:MFS transporter [Oxalobacteraceae bacterium CAVE-383]|nr:MFS transporter [Oxalobacteraceae bacterium CAVE-383]